MLFLWKDKQAFLQFLALVLLTAIGFVKNIDVTVHIVTVIGLVSGVAATRKIMTTRSHDLKEAKVVRHQSKAQSIEKRTVARVEMAKAKNGPVVVKPQKVDNPDD